MTAFPKAKEADIALLLEGTFPFVSGGVSSWVHQLIQGFPEYRFACMFLGSRAEDYGDPRYALPDNVVHVETHYLHDSHAASAATPHHQRTQTPWRAWPIFMRALRQSAQPGRVAARRSQTSSPALLGQDGIDEHQFLHSRESWDYITEQYREHCTDPSFVDYFWTVRSMHQPIWQLQRIADNLIPVKLLHTVSTGYAGFLGALLKQRTGRPLLLSEHGIYTKERKIDLLQSDWLADNRDVFQQDPTQISYFRDLWIRFFSSLGRMCYGSVRPDRGAVRGQPATPDRGRRAAGQNPQHPQRHRSRNDSRLLRNGRLRSRRCSCLIGRVVPIKDVKTFVRAMRIVVNRLPEAEAWIAGPKTRTRNTPTSAGLSSSLGLADKVQFLGLQKMELLPKIGVTVLSSISEGLPLVFWNPWPPASGVATDVGACGTGRRCRARTGTGRERHHRAHRRSRVARPCRAVAARR